MALLGIYIEANEVELAGPTVNLAMGIDWAHIALSAAKTVTFARCTNVLIVVRLSFSASWTSVSLQGTTLIDGEPFSLRHSTRSHVTIQETMPLSQLEDSRHAGIRSEQSPKACMPKQVAKLT